MEEVEAVDAVHDTDDIEAPDTRAEIEWKKAKIEQTRTEVGETLAAIREGPGAGEHERQAGRLKAEQWSRTGWCG